MKRKRIIIACAVMFFFIAVGILLYPLISTAYNERHQSEIHTMYRQQVEQAEDTQKQELWKKAEEYNRALVPGVKEVGAFSNDALEVASKGYDEQLNIMQDNIMGYVSIPKINVTLPIYHGTADAILELGVGHLLGSSLPVGGESTHTVLTAHSGMANQKMFSDLPQLREKDVFYLDVLGETLAYQVDQITTVLPYDTACLSISQGEDYCTLVTCTPFGVNTHRLLVRGSRIPFEKGKTIIEETPAAEEAISTWEQEYIKGIWLGIGLVVLVVLAEVIRLVRRRRRNHHEKS